jgi:hypothetical protein
MVNTIDPKLAADAFGVNPAGITFYLVDHVHPARLADHQPNPE